MQSTSLASRISVVVLTHNRADELTVTLKHLLELPEKPPIFVADNASADNTVTLVTTRFANVRVIECESNLGAAGRNRAASCVDTEYVAFCDDDTWWEPGSLEQATRLLDAWPTVGVLSARVVVGDHQSIDPTCAAMRFSPLGNEGLPGPALTGYMAGACVFRTSLFHEVGGYEPRLFIGGEEELVALDVLESGHCIVYCDQLTVHHRPSSVRDSGLRRRMLARNAAWIAWLRLPWPRAFTATLYALVVLTREGMLLNGGVELLRGLRWAIAQRAVVSTAVLALRERVRRGERAASAAAAQAVRTERAQKHAESRVGSRI